jgi:hypothetical protein
LREQINEQRPESGIVKRARDELIPRTMATAPAAVRKEH